MDADKTVKKTECVPEPGFPEDLMELVEEMAENVHDRWAEGRLADGWKYGPERNDSLKTHPCLVPYTELPESEREYDRRTALSTLRFIMEKGYAITRTHEQREDDK